MKDVDPRAATRNGFVVLSSDEDALAAIYAGAWTGSDKIALFETTSYWGRTTITLSQARH